MKDKYCTSFILSKIWASAGVNVCAGVGRKGGEEVAVRVYLTLNLFLPVPLGALPRVT